MGQHIEAVFENGVFRPLQPVHLPEHHRVTLMLCGSQGNALNGATSEEAEKEFKALVDQWRDETDMYSSVSKKINHPAYQRIISMGEKALPWILRELRDRPNLWFNALKAIAQETPVLPSQRANPKLVRESWLKWGREKGLIE